METQYKIIGGDGREYGPATLEELRGWIRDGRVSGSTSVWSSDSSTWTKAALLEELSAELNASAPALVAAAPIAEALEKPVGFWARLAACILDCFVRSVIFFFAWTLVLALTGWENPVMPMPTPGMDPQAYINLVAEFCQKLLPLLVPQFFVARFVEIVYEVFFTGKFGATPGKMVIGAKIVRLDGSAIGYKVALFRRLAAYVSTIAFGIGYLFIAFREDKRGLHDLMVGTKVVYKR